MILFDQKILAALGKQLLKKKQTIAVAESVTAGLIQHAIGSVKDAMQFFQGGITTYNIAQKYRHLGVEPIAAEQCNAVSEAVASQMALGVSHLFGSHWGIGITGYASPVPESGNKLFAYYAIAFDHQILSVKTIRMQQHSSPEDVQLQYTHAVLAELRKLLPAR
jgi:nicotinamide-nucleotide amidase